MSNLDIALKNYINEPKNPIYNFNLGFEYEKIGHTAAAASFYIRTGEFSSDYNELKLLTYEALLRLAICFEIQGSRLFTTKGVLLRAIALIPNRPEAYYALSKIYEIGKEWQESYAYASMGEKIEEPTEKLRTNVNYHGIIGFMFEKAVSGWNIGLWDESINIFRQIVKMPIVPYDILLASQNNLNNLAHTVWKEPITYNKYLHEYLKHKFKKSDLIDRNYSQCYQDMFVLTMLNGKRNGTFLEIGSADPYYGNNTMLLEKLYKWNGISIDYDENAVNEFNKHRLNNALLADATKINYNELLEVMPHYIDYLQIDCDPPLVSYNVLLAIPFNNYQFGVITFEHDNYNDLDSDVMNKSRNYLKSLGYELVVNNISPDNYSSFEDWWVNPKYVSSDIINKMKFISDDPKRGDKYMLNRI